MHFRDLYDLVEKNVSDPPVRFETLRELVNAHHAGVGRIEVRAISYPEPNHQAHYILNGTDRTSPYEDEFDLAEIRYCDALDDNLLERRYALTKELMHVFDTSEEKTDSKEKFIRLLKEIQNQPLPQHASKMFSSELDTRWMAAIILCPNKFRKSVLDQYKNKDIEDFEIAELFQIPEWIISFIMDDYYEIAFSDLMKK